MTANLKRWDPTGTDGTAVTPSGVLTTAVVAGAGTLTYSAAAGFDRGSAMGVEVYTGTTGTDQAYLGFATTAADCAEVQTYIEFLSWPIAGTLTGIHPFLTIRSGANLFRVCVNPTGLMNPQTSSGGNLTGAGQTYQAALNTRYRVEADVDPGVATVSPYDGIGAYRFYDDNGNLIYDSGTISGQLFGNAQPATIWVGDFTATANGPYGMRCRVSQLAIDTQTGTWPDIPGVTKNATAPTGTNTTAATATQNDVVALTGTATAGATAAWTIPTYPSTLGGPPPIANATSLTAASFQAVAPGTYTARLTLTSTGGTTVYDRTLTVAAVTKASRGTWTGTGYR